MGEGAQYEYIPGASHNCYLGERVGKYLLERIIAVNKEQTAAFRAQQRAA
jgi:hypothetical protein